MQGYNIVLWVSLGMLLVSLIIWVHKRAAAARTRAERERRAADRPELGGDSYFLPPAPIEQAVELANPVEIESLLAGESETVASQARRQLEATTDIGITGGLRELSFSLPSPARPAPPAARPSQPTSRPVAAASVPGALSGPSMPGQAKDTVPKRTANLSQGLAQPGRPLAATARTAPSTGTSTPRPPTVAVPQDNQFRIAVRELVLAWFEARGYRASTPFQDAHPIELVLHHRKDRERSYAFVVERARVTSARASSLLTHARASGLSRLLIAAEAGTEDDLPKRLQRQGIRVFDEAGIRAQLGKIDIRVAAKIIAVARSRGLARRTAAAQAAAQARQPLNRRNPLAAAKL
ncbi:MAG TPA: hypothetical protein VEE84_07930 [Burkholderiaceae bacterium]|nr:hypothetical protein [Burkholderiaceae bacterium]